MGGPIALAYVHRTAIESGEPLQIDGGARTARAVPLPFDAATAARR